MKFVMYGKKHITTAAFGTPTKNPSVITLNFTWLNKKALIIQGIFFPIFLTGNYPFTLKESHNILGKKMFRKVIKKSLLDIFK